MTDAEQLALRAAEFHRLVLDVAYGPGGMIVAFPRFDTRRPFQEGDRFPGYAHVEETIRGAWNEFGPRPTVAEFLYGENTLWTTGWFLWSQILRHRVAGDDGSIATARKCARDLHHLFRLSGEVEPGALGKPHGGRGGVNTSFDQSACPVLFYALYAQELATPDEKALAVDDLRGHGNYFLRRNWVVDLFGILHRIVEPPPTVSVMKYLTAVHAAFTVTGESRFRDAACHHMRSIIPMLPWPTNPYPTNHNLYYWAMLCDYWSRTELAGEADWIGYIGSYWQGARASIDAEGLMHFGLYDHERDRFTPYPDRWLTSADNAQNSAWGGKWGLAPEKEGVRTWVSSRNMNNRALDCGMYAALGLLARSQGLDADADDVARRILLRIDADDLRWWWDDGNLPDELKGLHNVFSPEAASTWQVAYWMGRQQGVW